MPVSLRNTCRHQQGLPLFDPHLLPGHPEGVHTRQHQEQFGMIMDMLSGTVLSDHGSVRQFKLHRTRVASLPPSGEKCHQFLFVGHNVELSDNNWLK